MNRTNIRFHDSPDCKPLIPRQTKSVYSLHDELVKNKVCQFMWHIPLEGASSADWTTIEASDTDGKAMPLPIREHY